MASSYNVVLLVDAADSGLKDRIKLLSLRLLNYLTCRVGLGQVRWSYRFLNSSGGRCRPPRRSDLRELGPRSWDEFEEEMQACFEGGRSSRSSSTSSAPAALTHTALLETLSDFQWDRPDITSPAKPAVVRGRRGRLIAVDEPLKAEPQAGCKNAVFILSPCPHTREQLRHFTAATGEDIGLQQLMDKLLPKGLQNIVTSKRVTLYWLDTSDWAQVWNSYDHCGYWRMVELMQLVGGRILPSESLLESAFQQVSERPNAHRKPVMIPWDSILNSLISNESELKIRFPPQTGTVNFTADDGIGKCECPVALEPIFVTRKHFKSFIKICLKGTVQNWNWNQLGGLTLDTWLLQSVSSSCQSSLLLFEQLLSAAVSKQLFLVADVFTEDHLMGNTGILVPISGTAAVLNVIKSEESYSVASYLKETEKELSEEISFDLPDIVNGVLNQMCSSNENDMVPDIALPEWIKQELSQSSHWSTSVVERWYPLSGVSGASGNLMESFRLISAASFDQDEQRYDQDITHHLSECYQKKASEESGSMTQSDNQKKRLPRTPVRQKMKTMPRALQMLNTARLNSKAQKSEGAPPAPAEKSSQAKRRSSEKSEPQTKKQTGFKSEDELITFVKEEYDKVVSGEDGLMLTCARNAFAAVKSYLKTMSSKQVEADCMDKIRLLLKTSKMIRQLYGQNPDKEAKLRECQLQAFLRLEMCVQCPSIQTNEDELEQVVEEITDMLRIISLTEDPSFLTKFLATVLSEYIGSIPKILSDIYFSLGTQIPEELALVLPTDGDDSFMREGKTPLYSQPSISRVPSVPQLTNEEDQLEELRTRSAKKRRTSTLVRNRSIAESSQTLRQIEIPKKQINKDTTNLNPVIMMEKLKLPVAAQPQKETEATKVRRNLFVQENRSPTRRGHKMPRSQSVSAVEGLKHKRSKTHDGTRDHKLLTKKVTETPAHKQITNRLLYRQIKGRCSESKSDVSIVEESPEKDITDVRRSPRIKQLALTRRNSSFYASQNPKSRNLERVHSASQEVFAAEKKRHLQSTEAKTPKRLLFGEVLGLISPPTRKARRKLLNEPEHSSLKVPERRTPRKTPQKAALECEASLGRRLSQKSPCTPKRLKTPSKSPGDNKSSKNLETFFSPSKHGQSTLKSPERRSERLAQITPRKNDSLNVWLRSPLKTLNQQVTPQKIGATSLNDEVFKSPEKTPKRHSNTNTPGKQRLQPLCTPQKSFLLQSSNTEAVSCQPRTQKRSVLQTPTPKKCMEGKSSGMLAFVTEHTPKKHAGKAESMSPTTSFTTRYQLRTPQKSLSTVPQTPTPKKHLDCKSSVLPLAFESTPKKIDDSPGKHTDEPQTTTPFKTRYPLRTPQKSSPSVPQTPTPKKCVTWKKSISLPVEYTPKKSGRSSFKSPKTTPSFKASALDVLSMSAYVPVVNMPTKSQPGNSESLPASENVSYVTKVLSTRESTPDRFRSVPKHTSPVLSKTLPAELKVALPCLENSSAFKLPSPKSNFVVCENLDGSSLESSEGSSSLVNTSQTDESIDISEAKVVQTETHDLKMKLLITRKPSDAGSLPGTPKCTGNLQSASPYGLRHTVDRQQREAAARLGTPKMLTKFSTPKSQKKTVPAPTYEVQLEMRESGLPKLRFKRTDSSSTVDLTSGVRVDSPVVTCARKAEEGPFGETWCNKHMMRLESGCASPRLRSSYNTPGKSSLQTLICQSYTPKRCASNTASPTQVEAASPWTPSPKYKDKNGSDFINNWPRKKKASAVKAANVLNVDRMQDYAVGTLSAGEQGVELDTDKATSLNDFLFDGVSKLQGNSPVIDWKGNSDIGAMTFKSRKRCFELFSPTKEVQPSSKRYCVGDLEECVSSSQSLSSNLSSSLHSSCEDEIFSVAVITPPTKVSHSLSTSGLLTLTQSPMLFKGKTPSSKRKMQDSESQQSTPEQKRTAIHPMNPDDSPFSSTAPKRTISRTYTRKKLIT